MTPTDIESQLRRDEGEVLHVYPDSEGYATIGVGRLIDQRRDGGISEAESKFLLDNDLAKVEESLDLHISWWRGVDNSARQGVLQNMCFQLGVGGLLEFENFLQQFRVGAWAAAKSEMLKSRWAQQTPDRAQRLAAQLVEGVWK